MNKQIDRQRQNAETIFNTRSLEKDYRTLVPVLKPGMRVLDVGCGTGAISAGIAERVGHKGVVIGIDNTPAFIENGLITFRAHKNLHLEVGDIMTYQNTEPFDLIVAARVLQWLRYPIDALKKMITLLKPGGIISILDYNHEKLILEPEPPASMQFFYKQWLRWRADAGMNNHIAEDLPDYLKTVGLSDIEVHDSSESYESAQADLDADIVDRQHDQRIKIFKQKVGIWAKVARSTQVQEEGYIEEGKRIQAIEEYLQWVDQDARLMVMKLKEVRGYKKG